MSESNVASLVENLKDPYATDYSKSVTCRIGEESFLKLAYLADFFDRKKTPLAASLLIAAIEEAIDLVYDDFTQEMKEAYILDFHHLEQEQEIQNLTERR